jgi:EF hand
MHHCLLNVYTRVPTFVSNFDALQFTCVMERLVQQDTDPATLQRARNLALRTAFREVDRDNNGALDCDELLTLLRRVTLTHVSLTTRMVIIHTHIQCMYCMHSPLNVQ